MLATLVIANIIIVRVLSIPQPSKYICSDFVSQHDAQELFASDTKKYGYLDNNKDGKVCDSLR